MAVFLAVVLTDFFFADFFAGAFLTGGLVAILVGAFLATAFFSALLARTLDFLSSLSDLAAGSLSSTKLRFFSLSDLKSVSYQPAPFNRNTGAEIKRFRVDLPQLGHALSGASDTF